MVNKLKNITVFQLLAIFFSVFVFYAVIDVFVKVNHHKKYHMDLLIKDIQKEFPSSKLTFQNIVVVDNHAKWIYDDTRGVYDTYHQEAFIKIKNNTLVREPNFKRIIFLICPLFLLSFLYQDIHFLKFKDLYKINQTALAFILFSIVATMFILIFGINTYVGDYDINMFENQLDRLISKLDLTHYEKNN